MNSRVYTVAELLQRLTDHGKFLPCDDSLSFSKFKSDKRGYVALLYSGTARSFSANFESHIINLMAGCPYTVHLFLHTYTNDNYLQQQLNNSEYANYLSVNSTLAYFKGYTNLDNQRVLFRHAVKANVFEYVPPETLRQIYKDTYDISIKRFPSHPPVPGVYYMWHSQRRSEELRQKYMNETKIVYKWTFRMRHDGVYYTNWWQRAFNVIVYNSSSPTHKNLTHDVADDWGIYRTRLYDMIYEPRIRLHNAFYIPFGWSNGGYNDQFAALSSVNANHYFMRILHVNRMLNHSIVHPETSIRLIAEWNNIIVDNISATMCYDIVRVFPSISLPTNNRSCRYKGSGREDCQRLCPKLEEINKELRNSFIQDPSVLKQNVTLNNNQIQSLLFQHISRMKNQTLSISIQSSSFYYFYRYINIKNINDPCLSETWSKDQGNNYESYRFPFVLRSSNSKIITQYNKLLTCGTSVPVTS
ncbi:unnamed protein product [Adineta ricciae]|uniref:Uncharacterized protein n=1 Tax=Adineta ricciae TaxID=249248 RepID=A0A814RU20_ADIRI|nr:unnamed protein product [Adineta ricciae]CAF1616274.1 unnamed protein product [Adineta ricciae]